MAFRINDNVSSPGKFNVKTYGAIGDGIADDTAAIQAAIDAARSQVSVYARQVYFPPGNYRFTHLDVGSASVDATGVTLWGDRWTNVTLTHAPTVAGTDGISFLFNHPSYAWGNGIHGINLCAANGNSRRLMSVVHQHQFRCEECAFVGTNGVTTGVYIDYLVSSVFQNCIFENFTVADPTGALYSAAVVGAATATTTTEFKDCYWTSNNIGFRPAGGSFQFDHCTFDYHADVAMSLANFNDEACGVVLEKCHFEGAVNGSIKMGDNAGAGQGRGARVVSNCSAFFGTGAPPAAQIDLAHGSFFSHNDSFSGATSFVRINRGGGMDYNCFAVVEGLQVPFEYPDNVRIIQDDSPVVSSTPNWKQHVGYYGQMTGYSPLLKEICYYWGPGQTNPVHPFTGSFGGERCLLGQDAVVGQAYNASGTGPATEIPHGRKYQFNFEQNVAGGHTVSWDPTYYTLYEKVPDCKLATSGQRLSVWFKYESDVGKWIQDSSFVGWQQNPVIGSSAAAPSAGLHSVGDIVYNTTPVPGGSLGWVCTTAGTPGTWKEFGSISL